VARQWAAPPGAVETALAIAPRFYYSQELAELERRLRAVHAGAPQDPRVLLLLARVLNDQGKDAEASEIRMTHPLFGGRDPRPLVQEASMPTST
jgi:hypothetical protein